LSSQPPHFDPNYAQPDFWQQAAQQVKKLKHFVKLKIFFSLKMKLDSNFIRGITDLNYPKAEIFAKKIKSFIYKRHIVVLSNNISL
jgi:hypothetical protein